MYTTLETSKRKTKLHPTVPLNAILTLSECKVDGKPERLARHAQAGKDEIASTKKNVDRRVNDSGPTRWDTHLYTTSTIVTVSKRTAVW